MKLGQLRTILPDIRSRDALGSLVSAGWELSSVHVNGDTVSLYVDRVVDGFRWEVQASGSDLAATVVEAWARAQTLAAS